MTTFIKIGGSLITDKTREKHFRADVARRIANELQTAHFATEEPLLLGHGSGSFGHYAAKRYGTVQGVASRDEWRGFAEVGTVAAELSELMMQTLHDAGLPVWRIQPSASVLCEDGNIVQMNTHPIDIALNNGLVPLVHGDVALDRARGGTIISTETIFAYLATQIPVNRIIILGEVPGVYDKNKQLVDEITPGSLTQLEAALGGSHGTDVTGGMLTKVRDMVQLVQAINGLEVIIAGGMEPGLLPALITGKTAAGTRIYDPS
ncbi:MAG: isopentenyl phosphate kinase [Chloroflexota bacterium]